MTSVLFVCLGNICRSPLAEGAFRSLAEKSGLGDQILIDSAGTGPWHAGNPPDPRSIEVAAKHGVDISGQRARQVSNSDIRKFKYVLAMDMDNLENLRSLFGQDHPGLRLFLDNPAFDVPDPYYGGQDGFEQVYRLVEDGSKALLGEIKNTL